MNRAVKTYTLKYIRQNGKKIFSDIICLFLSICSLVILTTTAVSYLRTVKTEKLRTTGIQEVIYRGVSEDEIKSVSNDSSVADIGIMTVFGRQEIKDSAYVCNIVFGFGDSTALDMTTVAPVEGRFPKKENEIAIEENVLNKLNMEVGDSREFTVTAAYSDNTVKKNFTVVGAICDYSEAQSGSETGGDEAGEALPNAFIIEDAISDVLSKEEYSNMILVRFKADSIPDDFSAYFEKVTGRAGVSLYSHIEAARKGFATADHSVMEKDMLAVIFIGLIIMSSLVIVFSLLLNTFMNKRRNIEEIKRLKLSGCGVREVRGFLLFRNAVCFTIALPFAAVVSALGLFALKKAVSQFWMIFSLHMSIPFIVLTAAAVLGLSSLFLMLSVRTAMAEPPLTADESSSGYSFILNRTLKTKRAAVNLGIKNFFADKKNLFACLALSSLCVFLFASAYIVSDGLIDSLSFQRDFDYQVYDSNGAFITALEIPCDPFSGVIERDADKIRAVKGAKTVLPLKTLAYNIITHDKSKSSEVAEKDYPSEYAQSIGTDRKQYGYASDEYLILSGVTGVDENILKLIESGVIAGKIDIDAMRNGTAVVKVINGDEDIPKVGETQTFTQLFLPGGTINFDNLDVKRYDKNVTVCAVVDMNKVADTDIRLMLSSTYRNFVLDGFFEGLPQQVNYKNILVRMNEGADSAEAYSVFNSLKSIYPSALIYSNRTENIRLETMTAITHIVLQTVNIIILFFVCVSVYNMIQKKLSVSLRTFAVMRSYGFGFAKAVFSQYVEFAVVALFAVFVGGGLALPVQFIFNTKDFLSIYPWELLAVAFAALNIISFVVVCLCLRPVYKKKLSDLMRGRE